MAYREDLSCQECLKRKVKSPMPEKTRELLVVLGLALGLAILLFAEIATVIIVNRHFGDAWTVSVAIPMLVFTLFCVAAALTWSEQ
jgi:hypothetical protein